MSDEKQFLLDYKLSDFERPSVTADVAAFMIKTEKENNYRKDSVGRLSLLLIKRGGHPFKGCWALPGGFLQPGETIEACALREFNEETGANPVSLMPVGIFSEPGRDPRGWIISSVYACVITEEAVKVAGGDDAEEAWWFSVSFNAVGDDLYELKLERNEVKLRAELRKTHESFGRASFEIADSGGLAFDHAAIIASAISALSACSGSFDLAFDFLPEKFTLTALQNVQEAITGEEMIPANFRRKIEKYVTETDEFATGAGHRPARLFMRKRGEKR